LRRGRTCSRGPRRQCCATTRTSRPSRTATFGSASTRFPPCGVHHAASSSCTAVTAATVTNLGQRDDDGPASTKRLFYVDWPLLDRHRDRIAGDIGRWIDTQDDAASPTSLDGAGLRRTMRTLAEQPFRTRPTFNTTSWGGHWGQRTLGMNPDARNTALGYELIAPESGLLIGGPEDRVEIPFQLLVTRGSSWAPR
jgi:hypothetical protein